MKNMDLLEMIGDVDEKMIKEAQELRESPVQGKGARKAGKKGWNVWQAVAAAAAVFAISMIVPNTNAKVAYAMSNLPLIGTYFELVTFRNYQYESDRMQADVTVPQINVTEEEALLTDNTAGKVDKQAEQTAEAVNGQIKEVTDRLIEEFETNMKEQYAKKGYQSLQVTSEVITQTEKWYVLKLTASWAEADGYEENHFYTIDRTTGKQVALKDLFAKGNDYKTVISENIKEQMRTQMAEDDSKSYWLDDQDMPEDNFISITDEANFYINENGELVICFHEGEVAPMYMGSVEFVIPKEVTDSLK